MRFVVSHHLFRSSLCFARIVAFPASVIARRIVLPVQASEGPCAYQAQFWWSCFSILFYHHQAQIWWFSILFYRVKAHGVLGVKGTVVCSIRGTWWWIQFKVWKWEESKTEKEYEVQLVLMDDFISCRWSAAEERGEGCGALSVQSICGQVMQESRWSVFHDPDVAPLSFFSLSIFYVITLPLAIVPHECLLIVSCIHFCLVQFRLDSDEQQSNKGQWGIEDCKSLRLCELSCLMSVFYTCCDFSTLILGKTSAKGIYSRFGQNLQAYIFH